MPIDSPVAFISAHVDHTECELFLEGEKIVAYIPTKEGFAQRMELVTDSMTKAEVFMRAMGIEPTWN